jgi:nucleotide-binding universal stress UspA family protein
VPVEKHVHRSEVTNVARSVAEHTGELGSDLIVMCTHGRGGVHGFLFGRIAQQIVGLEKTPVLLIPPSTDGVPARFSCHRLLVTLDGNREHEGGLRVAESLALPCHGEIVLLMVVRTLGTLSGPQAATARMLPGATSALLDIAEQDAEEYLEKHLARLRSEGIPAEAKVRRGSPVDVILETVDEAHADVIVLATHGKSGTNAFWSGSATPNVTNRALVPLLLVPVWERRH